MADSLVSFQDVALGYGGVPVLEGLTLDIHPGNFLALLGPNGCGKSTILKGIAGIVEPLRGNISRVSGGRRVRFGYVPQGETIEMVFPLTAFQVALMGTYGRIGPGRPVGHADRERVRACLADVGLGDLERKPFPALSGGQRQRVLIARALAAEPDILLLDEPLSGIDLQAAQIIMDLIERLHRGRNLTMVMVSHHLKALRERDAVREVVWVHEGKLLRGPAAAMLASDMVFRMMDAEIG